MLLKLTVNSKADGRNENMEFTVIINKILHEKRMTFACSEMLQYTKPKLMV
jgi:hypothetical protein